ncbi:MAG: hypothetical protein IKF70_02815, partial [Firmicutes bacterium]|nr:hypothetical protein [Bacillota bacterium]
LLGGRENVEFRLYPELNHVFVKAMYDDILKASKEYGTERHIGEEVIGDIAGFIREHSAREAQSEEEEAPSKAGGTE